MFELEFPLNALEVTGDMSLCLSGLQVDQILDYVNVKGQFVTFGR